MVLASYPGHFSYEWTGYEASMVQASLYIQKLKIMELEYYVCLLAFS